MRRLLHLSTMGALCLGMAASSCSSNGKFYPTSRGAGEKESGAVGLELELAPGVSLDAVSYTITGPGGFVRSGSIDLRNSSTLSAIVSGLPAGKGYTVALNGAVGDGGTTCVGSATFDIAAHATTMLVVQLQCREPAGKGSVQIGGAIDVCPVIDALGASLSEVFVGGTIALAGAAHDSDGGPSPLSYQWTASSGTLSSASSATPTFTCTAPGAATIQLSVSDGKCSDSLSATLFCTAAGSDAGAGPAIVRINEIESSGGDPDDWVELYNAGTSAADVSGWVFKDNDDSHAFVVPAGSSIAPGGYLVLDVAVSFGLGAADSARVFDAGGTLVDSFSWTAHAATTYGRCPNGSGDFTTTASSTKGTANACATSDSGASIDAAVDVAPEAGLTFGPWPGANAVATADTGPMGGNMSGLTYQPASGASPAILWAVQNNNHLFKFVSNAGIYAPVTTDGWNAGKILHYATGTGLADSEGVTKAAFDSPFIYVASERDNSANTVSRLSILRYDTDAAGTELTAVNDWNVTADLPTVGANLGLEAITWVPDAYLVGNQFLDESTGQPYDPSRYANHGGGLFIVGLEGNGMLYAYALDHVGGAFQRVATIASGFPSIMGLEFDRDVGNLWAVCDNTCGGKSTVLQIDAGRFRIRRGFDRPSTLPDSNNEGFAIAPESECSGGQKSVFWADDSEAGMHWLRRDTIPCGSFF